MADLISEIEGASWLGDKYGDKVLSWHWNWHDDHIMRWINNFPRIARERTMGNVDRVISNNSTGQLRRSLYWQTFAASGGDEQVFRARYIYYAKFLELGVGRHNPYNGPVPPIPHKRWKPIPIPTRKMKGRPHVVAEMRTQAKHFTAYATKYFSFAGLTYMVFAAGDTYEGHQAINRALFWASTRNRVSR